MDCGTIIQLTATPYKGYYFAGWNDGEMDSVRTIEVYSDTVLVAYFEPACGMHADLPIEVRYDWLLMLNVHEVKAMGYRVQPEWVAWYRVVGEPDDIDGDEALWDDMLMTTGYYLTIDQNLQGTGDYYCVLDGSIEPSGVCKGRMRSRIVHYASGEQEVSSLRLLPTLTQRGRPVVLTGMNPEQETDVRVYSITGQLIAEHLSVRADELWLDEAVGVAGCYEVCVDQAGEIITLRYIVE